MFKFQEFSHLYALALIPVLIVLFLLAIYWRRKRLKTLGDEQPVNFQLMGFIPGRSTLKFILAIGGLSMVIIGWANLQFGDKQDTVQTKGVDVVIALDVSKSMLATDIKPDRLTRAKQLIMQLADKMHNDRVAFIVFAGKSYMQIPLTVDYSSLKMMVQTASPAIVPTQGTVIGDAIEMAIDAFPKGEKKYKSMIIISDGEDHDPKATELIKQAAEEGIVVHTVGIGSPQGTTINDPDTKAVKLDDQGNPVISKLNEEELRNLAIAGGGTYSQLNNAEEVSDKLVSNLDKMEQKNLGAVVFKDYSSYFQPFLIIGLVLLLIEWLIPGANIKYRKNGTIA